MSVIDVEIYLPLVRRQASLLMRAGVRAEYDDLVSDGCLGLLEAAGRFDATRGTFTAYATPVVRGRMLDGLRRFGEFSRKLLAQIDAEETSVDALRAAATLTNAVQPEPDSRAQAARDAAMVLAHVSRLPRTEREVMRLLLLNGTTQDQAAKLLGLNKSAITRARQRAEARLRKALSSPRVCVKVLRACGFSVKSCGRSKVEASVAAMRERVASAALRPPCPECGADVKRLGGPRGRLPIYCSRVCMKRAAAMRWYNKDRKRANALRRAARRARQGAASGSAPS